MGGCGCGKQDTVEACQKLCQATSGCKRFVYVKDTYNGVHGTAARKNCCLKDSNIANYVVVDDIVSGPAQCGNGEPKAKRFVFMYLYIIPILTILQSVLAWN